MRGFELTVGMNTILMETEKKNITDNVAKVFVYKLVEIKGLGEDKVKEFLMHKSNIDSIKSLIRRCLFEKKVRNGKEYWLVTGRDFGETLYEDKNCKITIMSEKGDDLETWWAN